MRLHFKTTPSAKPIPFNYQELLTGTIHKWIGQNQEHGLVSLYSFSWLYNGKKVDNGLNFEKGTAFFFSCHDRELIKRLVNGIFESPQMFCGLSVTELCIQEDPDFSRRELFFAASPIFIKRRDGEKVNFLTYRDPQANHCLEETMLTKLKNAGINENEFHISFDTTYKKAKTKLVNYNGINNKASLCPVIIKGSNQLKQFAWNVGLGNSTGIGFGAIE